MPKATGKRKKYTKGHTNPRRGAPGMILVCETGREVKCRREGFQILEYYWDRLAAPHDVQVADDGKKSFEDELEDLKNKGNVEKESPFVVFETGCRGSVFVLRKQDVETKQDDDTQGDNNESNEEPSKKKQRQEGLTTTEKDAFTPSGGSPWDPLTMADAIFQDCINQITSDADGNTIPGSRFVTRIIPIQRTCFASLDEIKTTVLGLLETLLKSTPKSTTVPSFALKIKLRICGALQKLDIINSVAAIVVETTREKCGTPWTVNLEKPDYAILIEVCKSICGVSIVPRKIHEMAPNFNIAELRHKSTAADDDEKE